MIGEGGGLPNGMKMREREREKKREREREKREREREREREGEREKKRELIKVIDTIAHDKPRKCKSYMAFIFRRKW